VCGVDSVGSGWGEVAGCCECGDEPSGSGVTELISCTILEELRCLKPVSPGPVAVLLLVSFFLSYNNVVSGYVPRADVTKRL
jgi:hypothetical protein